MKRGQIDHSSGQHFFDNIAYHLTNVSISSPQICFGFEPMSIFVVWLLGDLMHVSLVLLSALHSSQVLLCHASIPDVP